MPYCWLLGAENSELWICCVKFPCPFAYIFFSNAAYFRPSSSTVLCVLFVRIILFRSRVFTFLQRGENSGQLPRSRPSPERHAKQYRIITINTVDTVDERTDHVGDGSHLWVTRVVSHVDQSRNGWSLASSFLLSFSVTYACLRTSWSRYRGFFNPRIKYRPGGNIGSKSRRPQRFRATRKRGEKPLASRFNRVKWNCATHVTRGTGMAGDGRRNDYQRGESPEPTHTPRKLQPILRGVGKRVPLRCIASRSVAERVRCHSSLFAYHYQLSLALINFVIRWLKDQWNGPESKDPPLFLFLGQLNCSSVSLLRARRKEQSIQLEFNKSPDYWTQLENIICIISTGQQGGKGRSHERRESSILE